MAMYAASNATGGLHGAGIQAFGASGSNERLELEAQVVQLRGGVERLERRLEEELRAFLGVCDKRMQAREEQLRNIGESLQASANNVAETLCQRVDARLRDLERVAAEKGDRALEEVWEVLRRLQADGRSYEGRLQRCALADDFADRLREAERAQLQRIDEKLAAMERRAVEHRAQLDSGTEAWREAVNQRCHALETRVWEQQAERGDLADAVLKRLPEAVPLRELHEEMRTQAYSVEVQQRRLAACEAKLSKLPALEAKVEFAETQTAQQVEEQAQTARGLSDVAQRLSQKLAATDATCQRVEAQGAALEARLRGQGDEDKERFTSDLEAVQQRFLQRVDDVESRLQRSAARTEREVAQQIATLTQRVSDDTAAARQQVEGMLREVEARTETSEEVFRQQLERTATDLRTEARGIREHAERRHAELDVTCKATDEKHRADAKAWGVDNDAMKSQLEAFNARLAELRTEARGVHERIERKHTEMDANLRVIDEQHRAHVVSWGSESEAARSRVEALHARLIEFESGLGRTGKAHESMRGAISGLEDQLKARTLELTSDSESLTGQVEQLQARLQELEAAAARTARGRDWNTDAEAIKGRLDVLQARASDWAVESEELRRRADSVQGRITDLESGSARSTGTMEGIRSSIGALEEKLKARALEWGTESESFRSRMEALQAQVVESQVALARAQTGVDGLRGSIAGLDGLRSSLAGVEGGLTALDEQQRARAHELSAGHDAARANVETAQARIGDMQQSMQRMQTSIEALRSSVLNLETQNDTMRSTAANQEVVIQSLHTSFREREGLDESAHSEGRADGRGGSIVEKLAVQQLLAASEARMLERTSKAMSELRSEVAELTLQMASARDLPNARAEEVAAGAEARATVVQDSVLQLRNEITSLRTDVRTASVKVADHGSCVANLQDGVATLKTGGSETAASVSEHAVRLTSLQERLREVEEITRATQKSQREAGDEAAAKGSEHTGKLATLQEKVRVLEEAMQKRSQAVSQPVSSSPPSSRRQSDMQAASASFATDASSGSALQGLEMRLRRLEEKVDASLPSAELEERLARLEEHVRMRFRGSSVAVPDGDPSHASGAEPDLEEPLTILEARLSRIEDHIQSAEIEDFHLVDGSAESPSTWSPAVQLPTAPPPQSSVVLRLSWSGEPPQLAESDMTTGQGLVSALRSALSVAPPAAAPDLDVVRADLREEPGSGAPCGAVCWLSTADARAAEAELRRQLHDPGSALRRTFPSLVVEDSSASARQPTSSLAMVRAAADRSVISRVDDLERSRELLAESLGEVERRMLQVERFAAGGALGMDFNMPLEGNAAAPMLGELSELGENENQDSMSAGPLALSDGPALVPGSVVRKRRGPDDIEDDGESSNEFNFDAASPASDKANLSSLELFEAEEAAAKAKQEKRRRAREEAAAAQEDEQRKAEEMLRAAEEERRRAEEEEERRLEQETEKVEEERWKVEEEQRRLEEEALNADKERWKAQEEQRRLEEEVKKAEEEERRKAEDIIHAWARFAAESYERQIQREIEAHGMAKCAEEDAEQARHAQEERAQQLAEMEMRRRRVTGLPVVAKARNNAPEAEVRNAFSYADTGGHGVLDGAELHSFLSDHLGFGQAEVARFHDRHGSGETDPARRVVTFEDFWKGYGSLDPYRIAQRHGEVVVRKPGSLGQIEATAYIKDVDDCEVYICDPTAQVFVDDCKHSVVLLGPCSTSALIRNCEDCTFWLAAKQLHTRDCRRCTFYLYSQTEPIIEASDELSFAPWAAAYPKCIAQFKQAGFDPELNRWNAVFDFNGSSERSHWRILPLGEVAELEVELQEPLDIAAAADSPGPALTHEVLCAEPLMPDESSGESLGDAVRARGNIPQTRPSVPIAPPAGTTTVKLHFKDEPHSRPRLFKSLPRPAPAVFQATMPSAVGLANSLQPSPASSPKAAGSLASPVGKRGHPDDDVPEASPPGGIPASSLGDLSGTSALQEGMEAEYSEDESIAESMELPLSPGASPLVGRHDASPSSSGNALRAGHDAGLWPSKLDQAEEEEAEKPAEREDECNSIEEEQAHRQERRPSFGNEGPRTPRVQGGMNAGEDSDSSDDGAPPAMSLQMSARGATERPAPPGDGSDESGAEDDGRTPSAAAPTVPLDRREMFGEGSSDEDEEEEKKPAFSPKPQAISPASMGSQSQLRPSAKSPNLSSGAKLARYGLEEDSDEDDVEAAVSTWMAAAPKRSPSAATKSPSAGLGKGSVESSLLGSIESIALGTSRDSGADPKAGHSMISPSGSDHRSQTAGASAKIGIGGVAPSIDVPGTSAAEVPYGGSIGAEKSEASAGGASAGLGLSGNSWDDSAAESSFGEISPRAQAALGLGSPTDAQSKSHEDPNGQDTLPATDVAAPEPPTATFQAANATSSSATEAPAFHPFRSAGLGASGDNDGNDSVDEEVDDDFQDGSDISLP